ncbi:MAG TPA: hypothetical protein VKA69_03055 [Desulfobacteria bacterium]|nr:hypothetical protein [Desulfobacteria bacterium]
MEFLDPNKPIATCTSESCDDCTVTDALHCHFTLKDLIYFLVNASVSLLLGGYGINRISGWMLIPWLILIVGYFGFVEIRVMCSHCPHYGEEGNALTCWANYGTPKIWKYRPGPMTFLEKVVFYAGFVFIYGYPIIFLIAGAQLFLLLVYLLSIGGFYMTLRAFFCSRCMNFACPLNTVRNDVRMRFFERNPEIAEAWGIEFPAMGGSHPAGTKPGTGH